MRRFNWVVFSFGILFLLVGFFIFISNNLEVTGLVPLTGILNEETGEPVELQEYDISFGLDEKLIHKLRDLSFYVEFIPKLEGRSEVKMNYFVFSLDGDLVYFDEENILIEGETILKRDLDTYRAQGIELEDGNYSFVVRVSYGGVEKSFSEIFKFEQISKLLYSLKQLFDISLQLDSRVIESSRDLSLRVVFESFGEEPTPVELTFFIYDVFGNELYRKDLKTIVETEEVVFVDFLDFVAPYGDYVLVMRSFYNVGVEDYFEEPFEIRREISFWPFLILGLILVIGIYFIFKKLYK